MNFGENIIIIWILDKSRSVAPAKLEIELVSPNRKKNGNNQWNKLGTTTPGLQNLE